MNIYSDLLASKSCFFKCNLYRYTEENQNTPEYLEGVRNRLLENLSKIPPKPSVPFHDVPPVGLDTTLFCSQNVFTLF